ncbi:MAG: YHYH protein [Crocinitomicaceae bacterium]|nr:YHYH protein [Crocinitomicaceae bacterium]
MKVFLLIIPVVCFACSAQHEPNSIVVNTEDSDSLKTTFSLNLNIEDCSDTVGYRTEFTEIIDSLKGVRIIQANGIPNHKVGRFPNLGNPNTISEQSNTYTLPLVPIMNSKKTFGQGMRFGILFSGVELDPFSNEFFKGNRRINREWNITPLTSLVDLGLDCNNAHVQPDGKYHYHGTPTSMIGHIHSDTSEMIKLGYAADGFPIYYKYGYDDKGNIIEIQSGYRLKSGERPGDGITAPNGTYDGMYFQDYEYVELSSLLDECNGRWGKTPEKENEYYYVVTDNFPSLPLCFSADPSEDFRVIPPTMRGNKQLQKGSDIRQLRPDIQRGNGEAPSPKIIMHQMDRDNDGRLSRSEVKGPLVNDFDRIDTNGDGFLTIQELSSVSK